MSKSIPNIFHFVFGLKKQTESFHLVFYLCLESCLQINKPEKIFFYYHFEPYGKYWDLIKDKLTLVQVDLEEFVINYKYKERGIKKYRYAHQSDFIRLEKLITTGGIYADIDTLFVNPIPDELFHKLFVLGRENDIICQRSKKKKKSICNAFIMSEKNSAFGKIWLENMADAFDGSWSNHSTILPHKLYMDHPKLIHVEPVRSFYYYSWTREDINTLLKGYNPDYSGIISIHLWSHLWWSRSRRGFSNFHGGLLTEDFIKEVDTTYNVIARKFLPKEIIHKKKSSLFSLFN